MPRRSAPCEPHENRPHVRGDGGAVHDTCAQRITRHGGEQRVVGGLAQRGATPRPNRGQAQHPVVEYTGEQHSDGSRPERDCHRTKQRVERRAVPALARAVRQHDSVIAGEQVPAGDGHIDAAGLQRRTVLCGHGRQRAGPIDDLREHARALLGQVQGHQHRERQVLRQACGDSRQGFHAACGASDRHNSAQRIVSRRHGHLTSVTHARNRQSRFIVKSGKRKGRDTRRRGRSPPVWNTPEPALLLPERRTAKGSG